MRLLLYLLPLAAVAAAPVADDPALIDQHAICPATHIAPAEQKTRRPLVHPLTEEPGARQEIAVQRTDADGCVKPIIVRGNVGRQSK